MVVYVDADSKLMYLLGKRDDHIYQKLLLMIDEGFELILWSARGKQYAIDAASMTGTSDLFAHILSKPGYIIDDKGWNWGIDVPNLFNLASTPHDVAKHAQQ